MKKKIVYLIMAGMLMLTGCGGANEEQSAEASSETTEANDAEAGNTEMSSDSEETQLANPWRDITEEEAKNGSVRLFTIPEGAENVTWSMMESKGDEAPLIQATFTLDGKEFTARTQYGASEFADISGMNYEWSSKDEGKLATWGGGNMDAKFYRYNGDECADLCTWYDIEIGIAYSLSTVASDLEGFDIRAVAEAMPPEPEMYISSFVEEVAGKTEFESYDEVISYLKKGQGYAYIQLKGYNGDVLALAENVYKDKGKNLAIDVALYGEVDGVVKNLGNVSSAGTAYPVAVQDGAIFACNHHSYEVYFVNPEGDGLMMKDCIHEEYNENGNATYIGFTRETNSFDNDVEFTGGEAEYKKYWENYFAATLLDFTPID